MNYYTNRLSIRFGNLGISIVNLGYSPPENLPPDSPPAFERNGIWYAIAEGVASSVDGMVETLDPMDIPGQVIPCLETALMEVLADKGKTSRTEEGILFVPDGLDHKIATHLRIGVNTAQRMYALVISPQTAKDGFDAFVAVNRVTAAIMGLNVAGAITIGAFEPVPADTYTSPTLLFNPDGTQTHSSSQQGLLKYGPYGREKFRQKVLRILVVCRYSHQARVSRLLHDLRAGIAQPYEVSEIWGRPWPTIFGFQDVHFERVCVQTYEQKEIADHMGAAVQSAASKGQPFDIVLYDGEGMEPGLEAFSLKLGIPCHCIPPQTIMTTGIERARTLLDLALVLYAKAGGEPWLLPQEKRMEHELVIGVGSTPLMGGVLGYATIFSSQGNYKLGHAHWSSSEQAWNADMARFIGDQVERLRHVDGWRDRDRLSILFHLDRPLSSTHILALKEELLNKLAPRYELEVAFLHLTYTHTYRLWDARRPGVTLGNHQRMGKYMPAAGTYACVEDDRWLLQLAEPYQAAEFPDPLLVELLPHSEDWGMDYLVAQVYYFCALSWRSVRRAVWPATLEYGKLIAEKIHLLRMADPNLVLPPQLYPVPWYL